MITYEQIKNWFTYHSPTAEQQVKYVKVRSAGQLLAETIWQECPESADTTAAIRKVREAVATANAAIACEGK